MKILLFGKTGQVGWELQRSLAPLGELTVFGSRDPGGDFTEIDKVRDAVRTLAPDVIVNAAAYTAVDQAEREPDLARVVNVAAPIQLANEAVRLGAWLVQYSTDYVFDGGGDTPRDESDLVAPLNVYGRTKAEAEAGILASGCQALIFRTSWVYASRGNNFARTMLRLAQDRDELRVINDQIGAPTGAELLADVTAHAVRVARRNPRVAGLYHLVAGGETSWYDYARYVLEQAKAFGLPLRIQPEAIIPVASDTFPTAAVRPKNSRLSTGKICSCFNLTLPYWCQGVSRMMMEVMDK